jgi:hypothetical protein
MPVPISMLDTTIAIYTDTDTQPLQMTSRTSEPSTNVWDLVVAAQAQNVVDNTKRQIKDPTCRDQA